MYQYVCPLCGNAFTSSENKYQCPACEFHQLLICYEEDGLAINQEDYVDIIANCEHSVTYTYTCNECGSQNRFYATNLLIFCHCGGWYKREPQKPMCILLKQCRQQKRLTQKKLAQKLGIVQSYLSEIEKGIKPIPLVVSVWLQRNRNHEG